MAKNKMVADPSNAHASVSIWFRTNSPARTTRPIDPRPIHTGSGTLRVRTSATAATRRNTAPIASRVTANPSTARHRGDVISTVPPGGLPPARVAQSGNDPLLVAAREHLGQAKTDRVVQRLVRENVEHHPSPIPVRRTESAGPCIPQVPQVDGRGASINGGAPVRETERHRGAEEPRTRGPGDPSQLRFRDIRLPQVEHPPDATVTQWGVRILGWTVSVDDALGADPTS